MNEIVFKPKHRWFSIVFLGVLIALLGGAFALGGYTLNNIVSFVIGLLFVFIGFYSIARRSTLIIIGNTDVVMKRLLLPPLVLEFDRFTDFTGLAFIFGATGIPLDDMTNASEFTDIFLPILEKRNLRSKGEYAAGVVRTNKALKYAVIPSFVITIVTTYILKKYFDIQYDGELIGRIIFIIMLFAIYFILQKVEEFTKE